ncbi:type IV pilin [Halobacteriales archaeon QS_4_62_28]|nr:MAG: type IV pilin [Halobacteriales archaeon QS_4_62_28]
MQVKELLNDDDAVSPVIGVILMVAITVILAAVIATFVLGLGEQVSSTAPQASFGFDYEDGVGGLDGELTATHNGGATIDANELFIRGSSGTNGAWSDIGSYGTSSEIKAGSDLTVEVNSDDTVRVTYEPSDGGDTATLGKWTGPDA